MVLSILISSMYRQNDFFFNQVVDNVISIARSFNRQSIQISLEQKVYFRLFASRAVLWRSPSRGKGNRSFIHLFSKPVCIKVLLQAIDVAVHGLLSGSLLEYIFFEVIQARFHIGTYIYLRRVTWSTCLFWWMSEFISNGFSPWWFYSRVWGTSFSLTE